MRITKTPATNIGLAIWRLKCYYETFVQGSTIVFLWNFCAKNPTHCQTEKRWPSFNKNEKKPINPFTDNIFKKHFWTIS